MLNFIFLSLKIFFDILNLLVVVYVVLSWFGLERDNKFVRLVNNIIEPLIQIIRKRMPKTGMIDFSPMVLLILLEIARQAVFYLFTLLR